MRSEEEKPSARDISRQEKSEFFSRFSAVDIFALVTKAFMLIPVSFEKALTGMTDSVPTYSARTLSVRSSCRCS